LFGATLKHQILVTGEADAYLSRTSPQSFSQANTVIVTQIRLGLHPCPFFKLIIQFRYTDVDKWVKIGQKNQRVGSTFHSHLPDHSTAAEILLC